MGYVFPDARVYIVDGIAGAGKDQVVRELVSSLDVVNAPVYEFTEDAVLWGWKHNYLPNIDEIRISLMESLVEYIRSRLMLEDHPTFVFNRFHISWYPFFFRAQHLQNRYDAVVEDLSRQKVHVVIPLLTDNELERFSQTVLSRRTDYIWKPCIERKLKESGFSSFVDMYRAEQRSIRELVPKQALPHRFVHWSSEHKLIEPFQELDKPEVVS